MRRYLPGISVVISVVFLITSVLQFHHHDCDGNIYIHLTTFDDFIIGTSDHLIEKCEHNHSSVPDGHDDVECSMHLGDYKASEFSVLLTDQAPISLVWFLPENQVFLARSYSDYIEVDNRVLILNTGDNCSEKPLLRAPPVV